MFKPPETVWIFHITAIDNLAAIAAAKQLTSKTRLVASGAAHASIAYDDIQARRSTKIVTVPPNGVLHDYVPFYFAPRSPMLFTINSGNVTDCSYRQNDIVHLVCQIGDVTSAGLPFAFSNYHAVLDIAEFFNDPAALDRIDWPLLFEVPQIGGYCRYWHSRPNPAHHTLRKESRQAEFLVHNHVPTALVKKIAVYNAAAEIRVRAALRQTDWEAQVEPIPAWYY